MTARNAGAVRIRAARAITAEGERPVTLQITDGRITGLDAAGEPDIELAPDEVLLPGLVDTHVHVNEPGRTEWEGFATATAAAARGGVTTILDMPLNSIPPTCDPHALELKRKVAQPQVCVDVGFWGGAIPGNSGQLAPLHELGVFGFKCFLLPSGVDEFPPLDKAQLREAMATIASFGGLLIAHAEDERWITSAPNRPEYKGFLGSRPPAAEQHAIETLLETARDTGCRVHVVHLSAADALPLIEAARADGVAVTVETCPHHLTFAADEVPDGATQFKCCPPIRDAPNREALWDGLRRGAIDTIVSDHSPCTPELKRLDTGDFGAAWGGIASLQLGLPAVWTQARRRGFALPDVVGWMAAATADLVGLAHKGRIAVGADADLVAFAPEEDVVVDARTLAHRHPVTPYHGRRLTGAVRRVWLRGAPAVGAPRGRLLSR
jgi:allantoinase